ncbi:MAG: sugar ABC transporter permease [Bradyrhizobium sp.]|nr:MAG: sugar ABC transporter permease [Bradyrhizobium sp.]
MIDTDQRLVSNGGFRQRSSEILNAVSAAAPRGPMLILILGGVWFCFYVATGGVFLTQRNLLLLSLQTSVVGLAAINAVMLIVTRNFDLSVGSAVALVGVVLALLTVKYQCNIWVGVFIALCCGIGMGAWQGFWVSRMGISSFIVTLAGMLYFRGISMIASDGATIAPLPQDLTDLATGFLSPDWSIALIAVFAAGYLGFRGFELRRARFVDPRANYAAGLVRLFLSIAIVAAISIWIVSRQGLPYLVILVGISGVSAATLMQRTRYGTHLYAIGGNEEAARLSGINVRRSIFWNFVIAGLGYGITGIALTARVSGAVGGTAGLFLELDAIAAAIIGGASLSGGRGRVAGALLGALLMGSLNNGMSLMNMPFFYQNALRGFVLLLAVSIDQARRSKRPA